MKLDKKLTKIQKKFYHRAITPIIATILILALVVAGVVIGFVQIVPYIERSKVETDASSIQGSLIKVDNVIWDMIGDSAGSYIPDSVPSRRMQITVGIGTLSIIESRNNVTFEPFLCTPSNCTAPLTSADFVSTNSYYSTGTYGVFSHTYSSTYTIMPADTLEYVTGSNPYQRRSVVSYSSISSSIADDQSSTNISMYRIGYNQYIELSYRPQIFVTQTIENGNPTFNVNIFLVQLLGTTSFVGTSNMFLKYSGSSIKETTLSGVSGDSFQLLMNVDNSGAQSYAVFNAAPGGFTTNYKVTTTTQTFTISG